MSRRGVRSPDKSRGASSDVSGQVANAPAHALGAGEGDFEAAAAQWGERLRRVALGLLASLLTARAYWPSETDPSQAAGSGLVWVLALICTAFLAITASLLSGRLWFRFSWTDAAVIALALLVGTSAQRGLDRRAAINLAWEWGGLCFAFVLARNLPRTRAESTVLAGALVATAVAVSFYGLYQSRVEIPRDQERFRRNPEQVLREANVPSDPQHARAFADRLLGSNEVFSTFALANSLAGFLVGPVVLTLAVAIRNLADRKAQGSRFGALALAALPLLCLLLCLMLTKSRSAWIALCVGLAVVAWQERPKLDRRLILGIGLSGLAVVGTIVAVGVATGRLDREVLTQSSLSMRYRQQYWRGAWGVITEGAPSLRRALETSTFWAGVGPGNFGSHYLLHKLPEASEEIQDPHNLLLDVWATAGFWAVLALGAALGFSLWNLLGPAPRPSSAQSVPPHDRAPRRKREVSRENRTAASDDPEPASGSLSWLVLASGLGLVMVLAVGQMNLFQGDLLFRWLILGAGWLGAALLGGSLWRRVTLPSSACGAAVLAMVVNLMAAGGISMSAVALPLWLLIALGLNLREDRPCGHLRVAPGRLAGIGLALFWAALAGSFAGAILPFWRCEAALAAADEALARWPRNFERAQAAYDYAKQADNYGARPWLGDAYLQNLMWQERGARAEDLRWKTIPILLQKATEPPRDPAAWPIHMQCAEVTRELLAKIGLQLSPREVLILQGTIVRSIRTASAYHPTNPVLHTRLAEASAELSMFGDAQTEAREALRLDKLLAAHPRERLANDTRERLESKVLEWTEKAATIPLPLSPAAGTAHGNTAPN